MPVTIAVTGQILIHQPLMVDADGARDVLSFLKADAAIANFEGVVEAQHGWATKTKTVHAVNRAAVASISELGFHALAHANNHAFDLGPPGLSATHEAMEACRIRIAGSGDDLQQALRPAILKGGSSGVALFSVDLGPQGDIVYAAANRAGIAPLRVRRSVTLPQSEYEAMAAIGQALGDDRRLAARQAVGYSLKQDGEGFEVFGTRFLPGYSVGAVWEPDHRDLARLALEMGCARAAGQRVVLAVHNHNWDADWTSTPVWFDGLMEQLVDCGADLIIGTGAPVMQPMRFYYGRAILSGLGNFVFHTARPATYDEKKVDVWRSVAARVTLTADGRCKAVEAMPVAVSRPVLDGLAHAPVPLGRHDAGEIFTRFVSRLSGAERALVRQLEP